MRKGKQVANLSPLEKIFINSDYEVDRMNTFSCVSFLNEVKCK